MSTFRLPDLGEGLAEAEILEWHVRAGDQVLVDQPMVSVETAKAVVEVPVPYSGTITALHGAVGDIIATGAPLIEFDSGTVVGSMPAVSEEEFVESAIIGRARANGAARNRAVPMARALAKRLGLDLENLAGSGPGGVIKLDDVLVHAQMTAPAASQIDGRHGGGGATAQLERPRHHRASGANRCAAHGARWRAPCRCPGIRSP